LWEKDTVGIYFWKQFVVHLASHLGIQVSAYFALLNPPWIKWGKRARGPVRCQAPHANRDLSPKPPPKKPQFTMRPNFAMPSVKIPISTPLNTSPSRILRDHIFDNLVALLGRLKDVPDIIWNPLKRALESLRLILLLDSD